MQNLKNLSVSIIFFLTVLAFFINVIQAVIYILSRFYFDQLKISIAIFGIHFLVYIITYKIGKISYSYCNKNRLF